MENISGEQLSGALKSLGVTFILDEMAPEDSLSRQPTQMLAALAASDEARLRLALIPLLLQHPEFSAYASAADRRLSHQKRVTLRCYYTAARYLQQKYRSRLDALLGYQSELPDLFSEELHLAIASDPDTGLQELAQRHQVLSNLRINWRGTYEHAALRFITHLERKKEWEI